ncbi:AAA family ATPase [Dyadobacter tibetensis]|uniref:AAA family ATPase n=1 Tax=Dyadobacter tibetensis TaxID=1211851 RepID=UPI0004728F4A|nr:SMC family ATPase [Dyadobacter tibetensis]
MIPKHLKIKGLYSYQQEQEIHFDPLTNAALFGIFGSVGSGKSSILEAITFALYGDTERLNKSGDDRTYNMMNLRSDELLIDFECIAGKDGNRYRFTVKGRRNSKNFKDVKTFERKGYRWKNELWEPLPEGETTEAIIGLSYDNFRRTIIIPQGRFQEFIELRDADRTRMMKELFQLEKYDLSRTVSTLQGQNKEMLAHVEGQLSSIAEVTTDVIAAEEEKLKNLRSQMAERKEELLVQSKLAETYHKQKLAIETIQALEKQLLKLKEREAFMQSRREKFAIYEICAIHFKHLLDQKKRLNSSLEKDKARQEQINYQLQKLGHNLSQAQVEKNRLKPSYENREVLLKQVSELEKVVQIKEQRIFSKKLYASLEKGEGLLQKKKEELNELKRRRQQLEKDNEALKNNLPDFAEVGRINSWYATMSVLSVNKANTYKEASELNAQQITHQETLKDKLQTLSKNFQLDLPLDCDLPIFESKLVDTLARYNRELVEIDARYIETQTKARLQLFATDLQEGEPCPLCGSEHHPAIGQHQKGEYENLLKNIQEQKEKLQNQEQELRKELTPMDRLFQTSASIEAQKKALRLRWDEAKNAVETHEKDFTWNQFDKKDPTPFKVYVQKLEGLQEKIKSQELSLKETNSLIENSETEILEKFERPLQKLKDDLLKASNTMDTLISQLQQIRLEDYLELENEALAMQVASLKDQHSEIIQNFEKVEGLIAATDKEISNIAGEKSSLERTINGNQQEMMLLEESLQSLLVKHRFDSENWVEKILDQALDLAQERKELDEFDLELHNIRRDLAYHQAQNPLADYDPQLHDTTNRRVAELTQQLQNNHKVEGQLEGLIKNLQDDLLRRTTLLKEHEKLEIRKNHLNDLAKLFRSSGFVDYASSIYLQNLIQAANARFHQMTHQQLHLELGEGNSFWVRDLLNGGHLRLLKTLSGGQKFQAALSLALALADHIHVRNASKHNFFFLDEGFGSLDKAALATVFETLKSLRRENRIVGIISHVEELQQEIQTYLKIQESDTGSKILASWE